LNQEGILVRTESTRPGRRRDIGRMSSPARGNSLRAGWLGTQAFVEALERRTLMTAAIVSGQTIAATLANPGQIDTYTFSASAGDSFVVSAGAAVGSTAHTVIQVFAPGGTRVINQAGYSASQIATYQVPSGGGGTYSMIVSDYYSNETGAYAVEMI